MIQFSAEYGDPKSARAFDPIHDCLAEIFAKYSLGSYTDQVAALAVIFRVSGQISNFGGDGPERLRFSKKAREVTLDLVVPEARWRAGERELLQFVDWALRAAIDQIIAKLRKAVGTEGGNWTRLRDDANAALATFEARMPHGGPVPPNPSGDAQGTDASPPLTHDSVVTMIKLYKRERGSLKYREAWCEDGGILEHWGTVGKRGRKKLHQFSKPCGGASLNEVLAPARARGYKQIPTDDQTRLSVEFDLSTWGSVDDVDKRHRLEARLNETLGWTGLGHVDGGSIGSGAMEVLCIVVDAEVAKSVITADLKGTEFEGFARLRIMS